MIQLPCRLFLPCAFRPPRPHVIQAYIMLHHAMASPSCRHSLLRVCLCSVTINIRPAVPGGVGASPGSCPSLWPGLFLPCPSRTGCGVVCKWSLCVISRYSLETMFLQTLSAKLSIYSRAAKNKWNIFCYSCPVNLSFLILTFYGTVITVH